MILAMIIFFVVMTLITLLTGVIMMAFAPTLYNKYRNKLMVLRVVLQAVSIFCVALMKLV